MRLWHRRRLQRPRLVCFRDHSSLLPCGLLLGRRSHERGWHIMPISRGGSARHATRAGTALAASAACEGPA